MGFGKFVKRAVSKVGKAIGKAAKPVLKPITRPLGRAARTAYSATAPFNPMFMGAGMFLQPEQMGIKSKRNQRLFSKSQQATRLAAAAAVGGAGLAGMGGSFGSMLPTSAGGWLKAGMGLKGLAGQFLGGGGAGGGGGLAGLYGAYQGYRGQESALGDLAGLESGYKGLLGRQQELAGLDPNVAAQMANRARQGLRGAQAERGIYESGVAAAQEAELMPQIEQSQRAWQLQQLAGITPQYQLPMESAFRRAGMYGTGQEYGGALAGVGGEGGGGGFDLADLAGQAWDFGKNLFGGGGDSQEFNTMQGGLSGYDYGGYVGEMDAAGYGDEVPFYMRNTKTFSSGGR